MYHSGEKLLRQDFRKTELGTRYYRWQLIFSILDIVLIITYIILEFVRNDLHGIYRIIFWVLIFIITSITNYCDGLYHGAYRQYISSRIIIK